MKENNINQVAMDIEETEICDVTERKGIFARMKAKVEDFGEKHPKVVKTVKGALIGTAVVGAYVLGKAATADSMEEVEIEFDEIPAEDVDFVEITEE